MADFLSSIMSAAGVKSAPKNDAQNDPMMHVDPQVQNQRDQERIGILQNELSQNTIPENQPRLQREIASTQQGIQQRSTQAPAQSSNDDGFNVGAIMQAANLASQAENVRPTTAQHQQLTAKDIASGQMQLPTRQDMEAGTSGLAGAALNQVSGIGATIIGGWRGLATLASGGSLEDAANAVHEEQQSRTYQPSEGSPASKVVDALGSKYSPLTYPAQAGAYVGGKIADATGSPGLATIADTAINALPLLFMRKGGKAAQPVEPIARQEPTLGEPAAVTQSEPNVMRQTMPRSPSPVPVQSSPNAPMPPTRSAAQALKISEPQVAGGAGEPAAQILPPEAQAQRAAVLQRIGLDKARASALTGNGMQGAVEAQMTKFNEPGGIAAKEQFDAERSALQQHAENIIADTGGSIGTDNSALYARGNTILSPLDSLKKYFDDQTKKLYSAADQKAGGVPVDMPNTHQFIGGDQAEFLGTTEGESLLKGVNARMKSLGMVDAEGNPQPVTIKQAEQLKQYLNNQWQPRTSRLIRGLKDSIDDDVMQTAGEDVYKQARAMRAMRAVTLDDPNGIAKIMDSSGPDGVNRSVPTEKIADAITAMPVDQLTHIVKTLQNVPPEIQPQAQAALAEIKGQFANKLYEAGSSRVGQWGARDVSKYLKNNIEKMQQVFTPDELQKINDLNDAGHILSVDRSYPGAAAQAANALKSGLMTKALPRAGALLGAGAGSAFGVPGVGAYIGDAVGSKAATSLGEKSAVKKFNKGVVRLSDFPK